ncbi:MAG: energy transducer TonB, partial [Sphingobium sp.]
SHGGIMRLVTGTKPLQVLDAASNRCDRAGIMPEVDDPRGGQGRARRGEAPAGNAASVYAPPRRRHAVALLTLCTLYSLVLAALFIRIVPFDRPSAPPPPGTLTLIDLRPLEAPPEVPADDQIPPAPVARQEPPAKPVPPPPVEPPIVTLPVPLRPVTPAIAQADHAGPVPQPQTAALPVTPAPTAPVIANDAPDSWEGRVLAALNGRRRYPAPALIRRQQGVPYVRFVMDRQGKVLSAQLERSCGHPLLDREAVTLPRRAQPLPPPPKDRPGETLELVVPIEFILR